MTVFADAITQMVQSARDQGRRDGAARATSLPESGYGSEHAAVVVMTSKSMLELRRRVRNHRWRRRSDNPGQAYMGTCRPIAVYRGDHEIALICIVATHYDV